MNIFTSKQRQQLLTNSTPENRYRDTQPVAVLSIPAMQIHMLISKIVEGKPALLFGLIEFSDGKPHVAYVPLDDLQSFMMKGVEIENDTMFEGGYPMSVYIDAAMRRGGISISDYYLEEFSKPSSVKKRYHTVMVTLPDICPLIRNNNWIELLG